MEKCDVEFTQGAYGHKELPLFGEHLKTESGDRGYTFRVFTDPPSCRLRQPVDELHMTNSRAFLVDYSHPKVSDDTYYATLSGIFEPPEWCP